MPDGQLPPSPARILTRDEILQDDPLRDFFVWWDDISNADIADYRAVLEEAPNERPLQRHLQENPLLLVQHLHGGHGRWVLPQKRLGAEFVPDFIVGERSSDGFEWSLVELQSPRTSLYVRSGRQSEQLDEGVRQILFWRRWLAENQDYARKPRYRQGLGLTDISDKADGLLLIGRERDLSDEDRERRKQLGYDHRIQIRSFDWVVREAASRIGQLANHPLRVSLDSGHQTSGTLADRSGDSGVVGEVENGMGNTFRSDTVGDADV